MWGGWGRRAKNIKVKVQPAREAYASKSGALTKVESCTYERVALLKMNRKAELV